MEEQGKNRYYFEVRFINGGVEHVALYRDDLGSSWQSIAIEYGAQLRGVILFEGDNIPQNLYDK